MSACFPEKCVRLRNRFFSGVEVSIVQQENAFVFSVVRLFLYFFIFLREETEGGEMSAVSSTLAKGVYFKLFQDVFSIWYQCSIFVFVFVVGGGQVDELDAKYDEQEKPQNVLCVAMANFVTGENNNSLIIYFDAMTKANQQHQSLLMNKTCGSQY